MVLMVISWQACPSLQRPRVRDLRCTGKWGDEPSKMMLFLYEKNDKSLELGVLPDKPNGFSAQDSPLTPLNDCWRLDFFRWEWVHVQSPNWIKMDELPSGYVKIAIENDHL